MRVGTYAILVGLCSIALAIGGLCAASESPSPTPRLTSVYPCSRPCCADYECASNQCVNSVCVSDFPTPRPTLVACVGDCNANGVVTVDELVLSVDIALGIVPFGFCSSGACPGTPPLGITCLVKMVNNALYGCVQPIPTLTMTATVLLVGSTATPTPEFSQTTASSTPTPNALASPTPTPATIVYRLTEGSTIWSSPAPLGSTGTVLEEPLSGTFTVVPTPEGGPFCLNAFLCLAVNDFQFQSAHFTIGGSTGQITGFTFVAGPDIIEDVVSANLTSSINGQPIELSGSGPFGPNSSYPPTFSALGICGAAPGVGGSCAGIRAGNGVGYDLMIFAAPAPL
jgi:hypothetical protein